MTLRELNYGDRGRRLQLQSASGQGDLATLWRLHPDRAEARHARLVELHRVSLQVDSFDAPRPIEFDAKRGATRLEYFDGVQALADRLPREPRVGAEQWCTAVGKALADLHRSFQIPGAEYVSLAALIRECPVSRDVDDSLRFVDEGPEVSVHGDFGLGNILVAGEDRIRPIVIDPEPAGFLGLPLNPRASAYLDLAHFISTLHGVFPLNLYLGYRWSSVAGFTRCVMDGYRSGANWEPHDATVQTVAAWILRRYTDQSLPLVRRCRSAPSRWWLRYRAHLLSRRR